MTTIANMIDFIKDDFLAKVSCRQNDKTLSAGVSNLSGMKSLLLVCYAMVIVLVVYMYDYCWRPSWTRKPLNGFSFVYFVGASIQALGFLALCMNVKATKSVSGISSQSLVLFAMSLSCRVFVTTVYDGYLPIDKSGDHGVQLMDGCSLAIVIYLLYLVHKTYVHTYQQEHDDLSIGTIVIACVTSACFIRAELNRDPLFDVIWALSLNLEIFQMLPQLYMLAKVGGTVQNTTAHYVVNLFISCMCRFSFWVWAIPGCKELVGESRTYSWNMNLGAFYILGGYAIQSLIQLDFMYFYVRAVWQGRKSVYLPKVGESEML